MFTDPYDFWLQVPYYTEPKLVVPSATNASKDITSSTIRNQETFKMLISGAELRLGMKLRSHPDYRGHKTANLLDSLRFNIKL